MVTKPKFIIGADEMKILEDFAAQGATVKAAAAAMGWEPVTLRAAARRQNLTATIHRLFNIKLPVRRDRPDPGDPVVAWLSRPWRTHTYVAEDGLNPEDLNYKVILLCTYF